MDFKNLRLKNNVFLAPMAGVTDKAFRLISSKMEPGLAFTEMVSAKGLYYKNEQTEDLLSIDPQEGPVFVQLFGSDPYIIGRVIRDDINHRDNIAGIDINMGCPSPKIVKNGDGAALGRNLALAEKVIKTLVETSDKPVSVKFRKGWDDENLTGLKLAQIADKAGVDFVSVHGRTREMFYSGKADWDYIKMIKENIDIPLIGNGDIFTAQDAKDMIEYTGCDGVMLGRGVMGNPWLIRDTIHLLNGDDILPVSSEEKLETIIEHLNLLIKFKGEKVATAEIRKHIGWYIKGMKNASQVRDKINRLNKKDDIIKELKEYFEYNSLINLT